MALKLNVSGTWRDAVAKVNVGGTWKTAAVWQNVSGVWKQITALLSATLPASISCLTFTSSAPSVTLSSAGTWSTVGGGGSGTWRDSGASSDYQARASNLAGNTSNATGTYNTWLALSTTRTWGLTPGGIGTNRRITFTLEIRMAASPNTVLATTYVDLENDRT